MNVHIIKRDIVSADKEVGPAGRVQLRDALDRHAGGIVREEENWPVEGVIRILSSSATNPSTTTWKSYQDLHACKLIVPLLSISIQHPTSKDLDILATPAPESNRLLKAVVEVVGLPVGDVIGELYRQPPSSSHRMLLRQT